MLTILTIAIAGAVGGLTIDLLTGSGHLSPLRRYGDGWSFGTVGHMIVGAVAALITLGLGAPTADSEILTTIAKSLAAGIGGEAVLLSIASRSKAANAEARVENVTDVAMREIATLRSLTESQVALLSPPAPGSAPQKRRGALAPETGDDEKTATEDEITGGLSGVRSGSAAESAQSRASAAEVLQTLLAAASRAEAAIDAASGKTGRGQSRDANGSPENSVGA